MPGAWCPSSSDPVAEADGAESLDSLRTCVDGSADLAQSRRGFENLGFDIEPLQRLRRREFPQAHRRQSLFYSLKPLVTVDACRHIQRAKTDPPPHALDSASKFTCNSWARWPLVRGSRSRRPLR